MLVWIVVAVVLGGGLLLFILKMRGLKREVDAAKAEFLQKVGYEYASMLTVGKPPMREKSTSEGTFSHHYEVYSTGRSRVTAQSWQIASVRPTRVPFQLIDRKLLGTAQKLLNLIGHSKRTISAAYPGPHPIGDADLDARFLFYAPDPAAAGARLRQPDLRRKLLDLATVCLLVDGTGAFFGDPSDDNVYASGASRLDVNPAPAIRSALRVHLAVEDLLQRVVAEGS